MSADTPTGSQITAQGEPRQTLAMRLAERNRQRALRAERLARLRPASGTRADIAADPVPPPLAPVARSESADRIGRIEGPIVGGIGDGIDGAAALEEFLRALTGARDGTAVPIPLTPTGAAPGGAAGEVLSFQRPERAAPEPGDLARLAGAGPGLIWALQRAGLRRLADLAPLAAEDLAARLGPIGRLVPAEAWLATARGAAEA